MSHQSASPDGSICKHDPRYLWVTGVVHPHAHLYPGVGFCDPHKYLTVWSSENFSVPRTCTHAQSENPKSLDQTWAEHRAGACAWCRERQRQGESETIDCSTPGIRFPGPDDFLNVVNSRLERMADQSKIFVQSTTFALTPPFPTNGTETKQQSSSNAGIHRYGS